MASFTSVPGLAVPGLMVPGNPVAAAPPPPAPLVAVSLTFGAPVLTWVTRPPQLAP